MFLRFARWDAKTEFNFSTSVGTTHTTQKYPGNLYLLLASPGDVIIVRWRHRTCVASSCSLVNWDLISLNCLPVMVNVVAVEERSVCHVTLPWCLVKRYVTMTVVKCCVNLVKCDVTMVKCYITMVTFYTSLTRTSFMLGTLHPIPMSFRPCQIAVPSPRSYLEHFKLLVDVQYGKSRCNNCDECIT